MLIDLVTQYSDSRGGEQQTLDLNFLVFLKHKPVLGIRLLRSKKFYLPVYGGVSTTLESESNFKNPCAQSETASRSFRFKLKHG